MFICKSTYPDLMQFTAALWMGINALYSLESATGCPRLKVNKIKYDATENIYILKHKTLTEFGKKY